MKQQMKHLAAALTVMAAGDHGRAKLIIGDTNSRYTRENVADNFTQKLSGDYAMSDVWVEMYRNGIYPTTAMNDLTDQSDPTDYAKYEIVDKIIYINPKAANTVHLTPQSFRIEQDYTYGHIEGNDNNTPLGDHRPVVVTFKYQLSGEVTAIQDAASVTMSSCDPLYDLSGRPVSGKHRLPAGIYVRNGKKVVVR